MRRPNLRAGEKDAGCQRVGKAGGKLAGRLSWSHGRASAPGEGGGRGGGGGGGGGGMKG